MGLIDAQAKVEAIAKEMYGAAEVEFLPQAQKMAEEYERLGCDKLPICMAKTQYSFSADASQKGAPSGFTLPVRDLKVSLGAGFIVAYVGDIMLMPGLPTRPAFYEVCCLLITDLACIQMFKPASETSCSCLVSPRDLPSMR